MFPAFLQEFTDILQMRSNWGSHHSKDSHRVMRLASRLQDWRVCPTSDCVLSWVPQITFSGFHGLPALQAGLRVSNNMFLCSALTNRPTMVCKREHPLERSCGESSQCLTVERQPLRRGRIHPSLYRLCSSEAAISVWICPWKSSYLVPSTYSASEVNNFQ